MWKGTVEDIVVDGKKVTMDCQSNRLFAYHGGVHKSSVRFSGSGKPISVPETHWLKGKRILPESYFAACTLTHIVVYDKDCKVQGRFNNNGRHTYALRWDGSVLTGIISIKRMFTIVRFYKQHGAGAGNVRYTVRTGENGFKTLEEAIEAIDS